MFINTMFILVSLFSLYLLLHPRTVYVYEDIEEEENTETPDVLTYQEAEIECDIAYLDGMAKAEELLRDGMTILKRNTRYALIGKYTKDGVPAVAYRVSYKGGVKPLVKTPTQKRREVPVLEPEYFGPPTDEEYRH